MGTRHLATHMPMNGQGNEAPCHTHAHERPWKLGPLPHTCPSVNDQGKNACEAGKARVMASHTVRIPMGTRHLATHMPMNGQGNEAPCHTHAHERPWKLGPLPHTCPSVNDQGNEAPCHTACPSMNDQWNEAPCHTHGHERPRKLGPLPHTWPSMNDQGNMSSSHTQPHERPREQDFFPNRHP